MAFLVWADAAVRLAVRGGEQLHVSQSHATEEQGKVSPVVAALVVAAALVCL